MLEGGPRNAVTFRGFSTTFAAASAARTVSLFHLQGPVVDGFANLQDVSTIQSIELAGGLKAPSGPSLPLAVKIIVAPAPELAFDGRNPHGAVLKLTEQNETALVATIADLHREADWIFAILASAIVATTVLAGQALLLLDGIGDANVTVTTPIGTVASFGTFTFAAGAAGIIL